MKSGVASLIALASAVSAHYTYPTLTPAGAANTSAWQYVRLADNAIDVGPITDVTSSEMKCYESTTAAATSILSVAAGTTLSFTVLGNPDNLYHPGYLDVYMCNVPNAAAEDAGSEACWFKIYELPPVWVSSAVGFSFPSEGLPEITFTIPKDTPTGEYLVRAEHIAIHSASYFGGAQFYVACGQLSVTSGGTGVPGPLVSFPGAYTGNEPGILIDIYPPYSSESYTSPGPAVWTGGNSGSTPPPTPSTTASSASSSPTVAGTVPLYGQCGGIGYTGPTGCAAGTCVETNAYYSQCLD